jgi:hypothetical protein
LSARIVEHLGKTGTVLDPRVTVAALLHDVGHGPFSHAFEALMISVTGETVSHEDWNPYCQNLILEGTLEGALVLPPLEHSIVSSGLDCDRMDYLLRDSHFCGVAYGQYDLNWLLHCLTTVAHDGTKSLGVSKKGLLALSGFLNARRLMIKNVYQHPKIRRLQTMMIDFLNESLKHLEALPGSLLSDPLGKFLALLSLFRKGALNKTTFIDRAFDVYQHLTDIQVYAWLFRVYQEPRLFPASMRDLAHRLVMRKLPAIKTVSTERLREVSEKVDQLVRKENLWSWALGIDLPVAAPAVYPTWVLDEGQISVASRLDSVIAALETDQSTEAHVYFDEAHRSLVEQYLGLT